MAVDTAWRLKERVERVDNGLEPPHDAVHPAFKVFDCIDCHVHASPAGRVTGWRIPDSVFFFAGKDSVQLCKQMKQTLPNAQAFVDYIAKDGTLDTPFIQIAFESTRDLNDLEGQDTYEQNTHKKFKPEPPPPITHATFISEGQAWIDAMGGKFRGDGDCGCVPHHYSLSIDVKSIQDNHFNNNVVHIEQSGHADIPMEFKDDGSLEEKEAPVPWVQSGYTKMGTTDCTMKGSIEMKYKVLGKMDEEKRVLHLTLSGRSIGGSIMTTCSNGIGNTHQFPSTNNPKIIAWDMTSVVDVDQDVLMPYQGSPGFTSSMKLRIKQTD